MRRFERLAVWILIVVLVVGAVRLAVVASQTESGFELIAHQWRQAALGWLGLDRVSVDSLEPAAQADFWLDRFGTSPRFVRESPKSAVLCAGAAWTLDSPGVGFTQRYVTSRQPVPGFPQTGIEIDQRAVSAAKAEFEAKCRDRCLAFAKRATKLDPAEVRWRRLRAVLLFDDDLRPRTDEWLSVLDDCASHDPDNALYDYLAVLQLWTESAKFEMSSVAGGATRLAIKNPEQFEAGFARFEQAQQKPYLAVGQASLSALAECLEASGLPQDDQVAIATSRLSGYRQSLLYFQLWRWQTARAENALAKDKMQVFIGINRQSLRMFDQAVAPPETSAMNMRRKGDDLRRGAFQRIKTAAESHPDAITAAELEAIVAHDKALGEEATKVRQGSAVSFESTERGSKRFHVP